MTMRKWKRTQVIRKLKELGRAKDVMMVCKSLVMVLIFVSLFGLHQCKEILFKLVKLSWFDSYLYMSANNDGLVC